MAKKRANGEGCIRKRKDGYVANSRWNYEVPAAIGK